jgi:hypothetical protein
VSLKVVVPLTTIKATQNKKLRIIGFLVPKILSFFVPVAMVAKAHDVKTFYKEVDRFVKDRGLEWTVKHVKMTRLAVTRYLSGQPLSDLPGVSLDQDGFPKWISSWKDSLRDMSELRILMTLLVSLRCFSFKPVLDTSTIESPWGGKDTITASELNRGLKWLGVRKAKVEWSFPHMSTKRGPLGQAILTSMTEVTLLTPQLLGYIFLLGGGRLAKLLSELMDKLDILQWRSVADVWAKLFQPKSNSLRRLSYFSDKEGKTRVIAICDYWTQSALKPLHDLLNRFLRGIKNDCTFNQDHFRTCLPSTGPYHSLDLHAATDRMPISLQRRVIGFIVGEEKADAWVQLLTSMEFTIAGQPGRTAKYAAGQPMGAYSSWPSMALTHHLLIQVSAMRAGFTRPFTAYAVLGDDVVIAHDGVAAQYRILLSELDMPISEAKTHVSTDTYEFAKRWIHKGVEITGFAIGGLQSVWKRYALLRNFLQTQSHHGWSLELTEHPSLILSILKVMRGPRFIYEHAERVIKLYMVFDSVSNEIKGGVFTTTAVMRLKEYFGLDVLGPEGDKLSVTDILKWMFILTKKRLIEKDLESFQRDAYVVNDRLYKIAYDLIPASATPYERDFMKETIPVVINWNSPMVLVLNRLIDESMDLIIHALDETADRSDFYTKAGLSKYFVSKGVFSMRASHSITLADSAVTKGFINVAADYVKGQFTVQSLIDERDKLTSAAGS